MIRVNVALRRAFSTMSASTTNWETLYYQKEKELQRVDEDSWKECERLALDKLDLIKAQQQLISKNEKLEGFLRKIHTDMQALSAERALELTELEVLKRRIRNEKRRALKDQELVTYRHLIRAVFSKEIGSLAHNDIRRYFRRNSFLLSRYRADRLLHDGLNIKDDTMSERKRGAAFGFAVAYAWLDLFDCIENAPYETFAFTHDIDLRPPQNSQLQFSDVDLTLLYHFFEVNNYPVRHPFPDASGNTEPADYDDDDILRAAI